MCDLDQNDGSIQRTFTGAGVTLLTALLVVAKSSGLPAADPWPVDTFDARARLVVDAAMTDVAKLNGGSPMHYWIAQRLFEQGERDQALAIVKPGVKAMRTFIEKREAAKHENIGANGFIYWASLNCYVHWHRQFDQELLDDYRYVFTHAKNYKGTTSNLSMIHTLALYLADHIWGPENLPTDGNYGPRGERAVKWLNERIERVAKFGSGEFASRPYMIYNVGALLTLDNDPWMRQEFGGNLTITDGKTTRLYDVTTWTITEETRQ